MEAHIPAEDAFETPILLIGNPPRSPGADQAERDVAGKLAAFISGAQHSLHVAIYDFQLSDQEAKSIVLEAFRGAAAAGKDVRIAYDHTKAGETGLKGGAEGDPALRGTQEFILSNLPDSPHLESRAISGSHLMHNKYVARDVGSTNAAVWTGSANFTDGAWSLQENNILRVHSQELADCFEKDFQDLWQSGDIAGTGANNSGQVKINAGSIRYAFSPGEGGSAASLFVEAIQAAEGKPVMLSTMVLSSGQILDALISHIEQKGKLTGVYDATQMKGVEEDWKRTSSPKLIQWKRIQPLLFGKPSTPFDATSPHDFMHNKLLVTDQLVVTGSFNLSQNAESNAENVLSIRDSGLVAQYAAYLDKLLVIARNNWSTP